MFVVMIIAKSTRAVVAVMECPASASYDAMIARFLARNGLGSDMASRFEATGAPVIPYSEKS